MVAAARQSGPGYPWGHHVEPLLCAQLQQTSTRRARLPRRMTRGGSVFILAIDSIFLLHPSILGLSYSWAPLYQLSW